MSKLDDETLGKIKTSVQEMETDQLPYNLAGTRFLNIVAHLAGLFCMGVMFFNPGVLSVIINTILVYISANLSVFCDAISRMIKEEISTRVTEDTDAEE